MGSDLREGLVEVGREGEEAEKPAHLEDATNLFAQAAQHQGALDGLQTLAGEQDHAQAS